ncbi:MAG: D-alanyl-D-alanine carboxypeptidase, partial [Betaproteobacteria bacterium]|nr:D-alanyl-D-alanine carboxypeptidase [Betaproteobacteria bacterium]
AAAAADERIEPASLTKLMTAYVVFAALRDGALALTQTVRVSEPMKDAPGSRMFIQPGLAVTVDELLRGLIVQSGNDAGLALVEAVAGAEAAFVERMNRTAARLGMTRTRFENASGLPDAQHYSTARDLYLLTAALIGDFPAQYERYFAQKEFRYNDITQPNRNRLLWVDPSVDGVKTGYTEGAGYCLIASSKRGERRLVSVLLGASSEGARARESQKLLNWGFQHFDDVKLFADGEAAKAIEVWKGAAARVNAGFRGALVVSVPKGEAARLAAELVSDSALLAPVAQGQRVGTLRLTLAGEPFAEYPLVALEAVAVAGIFGRAWDTLRLWLR